MKLKENKISELERLLFKVERLEEKFKELQGNGEQQGTTTKSS